MDIEKILKKCMRGLAYTILGAAAYFGAGCGGGGGIPYGSNPPVANDDAVSVDEDQSVLIDMLANDSDVEDVAPVFDGIVSGPSNGNAVIQSGKINYTPNLNFNGSDSFVYRVIDSNSMTDTGNVNITVNPINDAPVLNAVGNKLVNEGSLLEFQVSGSDVDGPALEYSAQNLPAGASLNSGTGQFSYTPSVGQHGSYSVRFIISDSTLTDYEDITIEVNSVPVWSTSIADAILDEDFGTVIHVADLSSYVSDADSDPLSFQIYAENTAEVDAQLNGNELRLNSVLNWHGVSTITVRVSDGRGGFSDDSLMVTVNPVNDAPVANDDSASVDEDSSNNLIDVLANDSDAEDGMPQLDIIVSGPGHGTAVISAGKISYTPNPDYFGSDSLVYRVKDSSGALGSATLNITVSNINDAPVLDAISDVTGGEKTLLSSALLSASDADPDTLEYRLENAPVGMEINPSTNVIEWTPPTYDSAGTYVVRVIVEDGNGGQDSQDINFIVTNTPCHKIAFDFGGEIYLMNEDGSKVEMITDAGNDECPAWSPDGTKIAFVFYYGGKHQICVINRDGTGRQNISNNSCDNYTPAYAPDGTKIAFTYTKHGNQKIAIMNPNGTDQVLFISTNPNSYLEYTPRWSPDKAFMYFTLYPGTLEVYRIPYTVPADSMDQVNISNNSHHDSGADCSPDGTKIVYASNRDGNWEIYKGNPDGSGLLQKLTDTSSPESNRSPRWSPDGTRIVYENGGKIWIMNSDGTNKINIGPDSINGMNPTWSPHKE